MVKAIKKKRKKELLRTSNLKHGMVFLGKVFGFPGLTVGMSSLAAGLAIGIVGDAGVRANAQQPRLFVGMILILIFAEAGRSEVFSLFLF